MSLPVPYYSEPGITIYHGDARELVPLLDPAAPLACDPPYGTGWYENDRDITLFMAALFASRDGFCFGYPERLVRMCMTAQRVPSEWIVWWPTNGACRGFNLAGARNESEHIAFFGRHRVAQLRQSRGESSRRMYEKDYKHTDGGAGRGLDVHGDQEMRRVSDVWTMAAPGLAFLSAQRLHTNQKPDALLLRLVEAVSEPGQTILDPTCGSGTALLAARSLGRPSIGIDIDEQSCETAAKRLAQQVLFGAP